VSTPAKGLYTPPRPNLGPEPFSDSNFWPLAGLVGASALAFFILWKLRSGKRSLSRRSAVTPSLTTQSGPTSPLLAQDPLVEWSVTIRATLAQQLGPAWLAKTTEEIANDPFLEGVIPDPLRQRLETYLAAADRTKFGLAPEIRISPVEEEVPTWELDEINRLLGEAISRSPERAANHI